MDKARVGVKCTVDTASGSTSSTRKGINDAVENASKRKKIEAEESESNLEIIKEINRYVDESSDDIAEYSGSDDSEGSEGSEKIVLMEIMIPCSCHFVQEDEEEEGEKEAVGEEEAEEENEAEKEATTNFEKGEEKGLLQELDSFDLKDENNLNRLQFKFKEKLNGKRFLIVLDDVWNDNYNEWDDLRSIFVQGGIRSKITMRTRKESIALIIVSGAINVGTLSNESFWDLFRRHPLENKDPLEEYPELEEYFSELRLRSLFERVLESSERDGGKFLMHDLVNDFTQISSSKLCVRYLKDLLLKMGKLINLQNLAISNPFLLKMPLHLRKLKNLHVLIRAKFLIGGLRREDLGEAHYLYGSLSILEL
ncbi:hypothetical protein CQW23_26674 [Capsicum baccatum]|uniref:NB-ARC domain-containing protein n=1 Tax=Capsicum baccatum TaxID=33114 RepID=A0A2G2VPG7_CAPBA|nr:hypothetical protein CQW23_26674 [Capsicum baccatum]